MDGQHWYRPDGSPFYSVLSKDGTERGVTLRDARQINAVPSVTTVLQVLAKPALETWKVRQGILAALTLSRLPGEADETFIDRLMIDSKEQAKQAAEEGSRIHDALEHALKGMAYPKTYSEHVTATLAEIRRLFPGVSDWVAEKSFAHHWGFGGKVDLHSPSTGIVIDYKGKDGDFSDGKKLAYDQHYQLAAYNRGLNLPPTQCANIFVSRTHPGLVASHVWSQSDIFDGWEIFESALRLWKKLKRYDPTSLKAAA